MERRCSSCKEVKKLTSEHFHARKSDKKGFDTICIACKKVRDKERYEKKRVKILEQKKRYYQRKKRRALASDGS